MTRSYSRARILFDWILGITLLAIGILGWFLPILQGWLFIIAGLAVLSSHSRWARAIYQRFKGIGRSIRQRIKPRAARSSDPPRDGR